jgi:hypothetical protein
MRFIALALLSFIAGSAGLSQAQEPPGRMGRLAFAEGGVSIYQDSDQGWEKAYVNSPITSENSVWTEPGARAELRLGGTALRLDGATQLDVSEISDDALDANLVRGTLNVRMRYKQRAERFAISTPHARFLLEIDGRYRVDADPDNGQSRLTVFAGGAGMETSRGSVRVVQGQSIVVYGASSEYVLETAGDDAFDRWALERDDLWRDAASRRYVSTNMTGYEDLDGYGQWSQDADYGALWFPAQVASDWAPYRDGRWSYVRPWGWTWIDDAPWGYAPSHYGRWVFVRNRWGWDPGRRVERPAWAPALVGWVGGSNWTVGTGPGPAVIGWYPLAPWERYAPWYRTNANYLSRINSAVQDRAPRQWQGHGDDWRRINRDHATTVMHRDAMLDRRPVQGSRVAVAPEVLRRQQTVAPAQVQQALPQHNELIRRRVETRPAATALVPRPGASGAPVHAGAVASMAQQNSVTRPDFSRHAAPAALAPAPANRAPAQATRPGGPSPGARVEPTPPAATPGANPVARGGASPAARIDPSAPARGNEARPREAQQAQPQPPAQQQAPQQREAQQRDAQQREAQQRQAREAQQQQERTQREAQQQQQRATQQLQQQQERAAREAQQQAQQAAQQAQQVQRAQEGQRAAQEAQRAVQEAQRAARGTPPAPAQPAPAAANPVARVDREKEKEKEKEDKQR